MKKKRFIRILKRVMVLLLCCSLVSGICFNKYKIEAHAAALSAEASAEMMMLLWNFMINGMVASGAGDLVANYDEEKLTFETFMNKLSYEVLNAPDPNECGYVTLEDGTRVGLVDVLDGVKDGSITLPNEQDWGEWRVGMSDDTKAILEAFDGRGTSGPPEDPGDPDPPVFSKIQEFLISIGVIKALTDTVSDLYDGLIEDLEYLDVYDGVPSSFRGYVSGIYYDDSVSSGVQKHDRLYYNYILKDTIASPEKYRVAAHLDIRELDGKYTAGKYSYIFNFYGKADYSSVIQSIGFSTDYEIVYSTGRVPSSGSGNYTSISITNTYSSAMKYNFNFPIFWTKEAVDNYLKTGDDSAAINGPKKDLGVIITATPEIISPLTDKKLSPSVLQHTYTGMKTAYQTQIKPQLETETDIESNTETYKEVMKGVVTETVAEMETQPDTGTGIEPGTGTQPGTGTEPGIGTQPGTGTDTESDVDIDEYAIDLRRLFPFCIPFDFVELLRVLNAEPEAPRFEIPLVVPSVGIDEVYVIDLSIFDDVMEVVRLFELVGFVIGLMLLTGKVIKW